MSFVCSCSVLFYSLRSVVCNFPSSNLLIHTSIYLDKLKVLSCLLYFDVICCVLLSKYHITFLFLMQFAAKICLLTSFRDTCFIEIMPLYQAPQRGKTSPLLYPVITSFNLNNLIMKKTTNPNSFRSYLVSRTICSIFCQITITFLEKIREM